MVSMVEIVINCMMLMPSTKEGTGLGVILAIPSTKSWEILEDGLTLVMMVLSGALLRAVYFPWGKVRNHLQMTSPDVTPHESALIEGFRTCSSSSAVAVGCSPSGIWNYVDVG